MLKYIFSDVMKSLLIVFGALLLIIASPFVFASVDDAITESASQSFAGVTGTDNATVYLGRALYNDDTQSVTGISSNETSDSPSAYSYNSVSRALVVSGLVSSNRTLEVEFDIDATTIPAGVATFLTLLRWFYVFTIVGMSCGAIYAFFD